MRATLITFFLALSIISGCASKFSSGGEDLDYLKDLQRNEPKTDSKPLLPLYPGNYWEMTAISEKNKTKDKIEVVGPIQIAGQNGLLVKILRNGSLWRQEVYRNDSTGIWLMAFGEKQTDLLQLDPPMRLLASSFHEGDEGNWKGNILFKTKRYEATGYCRITSQETLQTQMGRFQTYKIDSVISMVRPNDIPLHFPAIRWLSRDIGFIQRSYADGGRPAVQNLERYMVRGKLNNE
ncbi:hypothetical protein [Armatimonas sp.]|uniref:hypothetical protein n=1 Tax=Armatimonas sp. TaxID=1872638 RepID=UPI00286B4198|nr:hypothetical protein [Armatimonas sp.]